MIRNLLRAAVLGGGAYYLFKTEQGMKFRTGLMAKVKEYVDSLGLNAPEETETAKKAIEEARPS